MDQYNYERDHLSLDEGETPAMACVRRCSRWVTVTDEQLRIVYRRE